MDPPLVNETSFSPANPASYSLTEIWPFRAEDNTSNGGSGLRMSNLGRNSNVAVENLVNRDGSAEESTVTDQSRSRGNGGKKRKDSIFEVDNSLENLNGKRIKELKSGDENDGSKIEGETRSGSGNNKPTEQSVKPSEPPKQDYIHVRARRGQATDSHSLAERARREKISERMKLLQDLVPGCNKVIGKALVLDEIINYIQSLQHQVEFLSMKLEAMNSRIMPATEGFSSKNVFDAAGMIFGSQETREYTQGSETEWLHMQLGGNFERAT